MTVPRIIIPNLRVRVAYGSHMPVLISVINRTRGPVLELGGGFYSTPFLHWACRHKKRRLVTCDSDEAWLNSLDKFGSDLHEFRLVDNWDSFDVSEPWNVVFVDQRPAKSRGSMLPRLTHVDFVVVHDTEQRNYKKYGYTEEIMDLYQYKFKYRRAYPYTSVLSNKYPVRRMAR